MTVSINESRRLDKVAVNSSHYSMHSGIWVQMKNFMTTQVSDLKIIFV
jgi:hypothetical protein